MTMVNFMRAAINAPLGPIMACTSPGRTVRLMPRNISLPSMPARPMSAADFLKMMRQKRAVVELDNKLASRSVNEGFSGGEKKRNEIFQMAVLEPRQEQAFVRTVLGSERQ